MSQPRAGSVVHRDVVVVGAGVAGLSAALSLAPLRVSLLTKARLGAGSNSAWAQGGIAAAVGPGDSARLHAADTLAVGGGLNDARIVDILTGEGARRIERLINLGAAFDRNHEGELALGREAAHSARRILHAQGDQTGAELVRALTAAVAASPHVCAFEETLALDLIVADGRVVGVLALDPEGEPLVHLGRAVVLATGGIGQVYAATTNPPEATGDGLAMAARAGARLTDLEFVQFHPTALDVGLDPMPLLTEALRGEGALLLDASGQRFMPTEHPLAELAPRDVVARAIARRRSRGERVFLDARAAVGAAFPERFPTVFAHCQRAGLDPRRELLPVAVAAHYHMGGVAVDERGRTSLPGLSACGEVAATGAHGANRLASNSLLEAAVFGARVAEDLAASLPPAVPAPRLPISPWSPATKEAEEPSLRPALRAVMTREVGVERSGEGLRRALSELEGLQTGVRTIETRNLLDVARLIATAALARGESRGSHFRSDQPAADPAWERRLAFTLDPAGEVVELPAQEVSRARAAAGGEA